MTNHMNDHDSLLRLAAAWEELPEVLRKQIFKAVYRSDPRFLDKIAEEIGGGFTLKKLVARPAPLVPKNRKLLFTMKAGKEFCWLVREYFTNCNKTINDDFINKFYALANKSPDVSSKQITENVLAILHSEFKDDHLWNLYENALPVCEPSRFSDNPVDPMMLRSHNKRTSHTESIPDGALTLQSVPTRQDQEYDPPKEDSVSSQNLKPSNKCDRKSSPSASDKSRFML